jgi:hypothetical protein
MTNNQNEVVKNMSYITFIILQNKQDYHTDFPNKEIWQKNMIAYVQSYLKENNPTHLDFINVPKYLIDAPFETPNTCSENDSENDSEIEDDYEIIIEEDVNEILLNFDNFPNHYVIRIYKIPRVNKTDNSESESDTDSDLSCSESGSESGSDSKEYGCDIKIRDKKAYDDFMAGENDLSPIASVCSKILLTTYLITFTLGAFSILSKINPPEL